MKIRILSMLLALSLVVTLLPGMALATGDPFVDYPVQGGNIKFDKVTGEIIRCDATVTVANIPSSIDGVTVTGIGRLAFANVESLTSVSMPNTVKKIGDDSFLACKKLTSIIIPSGVTTIGEDAFSDSGLIEITIPASVTSIGVGAFNSATLESIIVDNNNVTYSSKNGVLYTIDGVTLHTYPGGKQNGSYVVPNGTIYIAESAFSRNGYIHSVDIPDSVTSIGGYAFEHCGLTDVVIPNSVTNIGGWAFSNCENLTNAVVSGGINAIADYTFFGCNSLSSVDILSGVTSIGYEAFVGCSNLKSIVIPNSVTSIEGGAFYGCKSLKDIYYSGNKEQWDKVYIDDYRDIHEEYTSRNSALHNATVHYNSTGMNGSATIDTLGNVKYLREYSGSNRTLFFNADILSLYTLSPSVDASRIDQFIEKYVFVETDEHNSFEITDVVPVESKIGTVEALGEYSLTIDEEIYQIDKDLMLPDSNQKILYHIYNKVIEGYTVVEQKTGVLEKWNGTSRVATIDGKDYPTNYLTDLSFLASLDNYIGKKVAFSVSGQNDYKPLICIDELVNETVKVETNIAVFSTEKSLTVQTGSSMWLGFGKITDGQLADNWSKMAVVVSNPSIISLSDYEKTEYGYSLKVIGNKQGATNVTITDTESGASTIIVVTVRDSYIGTYSYAIDRMETFYPGNKWEGATQTNIYNLNGLYVNNYQASKTGTAYTVSFDVYNSRYHTGAVDIYDADGNWIDCEEIKKYSMISSLWDTGEQAYYLISDAVSGKLLTYEQASFAEHTSISIEVPDGGYFTISNNFAESPGAFLFNSCDILYDGACTLIGAALDVKNDKVSLSAFSGLVKDEITKDKTIREQFSSIFKKTVQKEIRKCLKNFVINEADDRYADLSGLFENFLNSVEISWKHFFKIITGVGESAFTKFSGPAGVALKGCFAFTKGGNQLLQAVHLAASIDSPYVTVFSSISEGQINPHGVIVNTNGNVDAEAVLQVFRVSNNNTIEVFLDSVGDESLYKYELYNICFVKDDQLVQPNGRVTVRIPIPDGMKSDTCNVYRQEADGGWTILTARIEGNYLVFETDHFSLYGIVGDLNGLKILTLPNKMKYEEGDILITDGLTLSLGSGLIETGFICDPMVLSRSGTQKITVRYGLASTEFEVSVAHDDKNEGSGGSGPVIPSTPTSPLPSTSTYPTTITQPEHGTVEASLASAVTGAKVTLTVTPDDGYVLGSLTVTDINGNVMSVTDNGNGTHAFTMPQGGATVNATFKLKLCDGGVDCPSHNFTDVDHTAWYHEGVDYAIANKLMFGKADGIFAPDGITTRAEMVTILYRLDGEPAATKDVKFDDVPGGQWYSDAINWAAANEIVGGYGNGKFGPSDTITREQMATILYRYASYKGYDMTKLDNLTDYTDADTVSDWADTAVKWAVAEDVINGTSTTTLSPSGDSTRAQAATIFMRFCENITK